MAQKTSKLFKQMKANKPIKIFVDCHKFDEDYQGITSYIKGLYNELSKDENFHFYFASSNSISLKKVFGEASNITYLDYFSNNKWIRLLIDIPLKILKYKIDFAHFQYVVSPFKFCKYIVTIHDVLFLDYPQYFDKKYRFKNNFLFKTSAKMSEIVLTVSEYSKQRIAFYYNISSKISVVPNGINSEYLQEFNKEKSKIYIKVKYGIENFFLLVSRIEPRKNHLLLLKTFYEEKFYLNYSLLFIGKRDLYYKEFEVYLENIPEEVRKKIYILENIDNSNLIEFYRAAILFIYPSFAEGFGIPPIESIAVNTPTLCSNSTAMSDFDFLNNFLFDPKDNNELTDKIKLALKENQVYSQREKMISKYNWTNNSVKFLEAVYSKT